MNLALLMLLGSTENFCNFSKFKGFFFHSTVPNISVTLFIVFRKFFPSNTQLFGTQFLDFNTKCPYTLISFARNFASSTNICTYCKVESSRLVYYSILELFPFISFLKILGCTTNRDNLLLATLRYLAFGTLE